MRRRNFLRNITLAGGAVTFQGVPLKMMAQRSALHQLAASSTNDRVLVILQLHGGNDGLNTFIPLSNYDEYYYRRSNIAIPFKSGARTLIPLDSTAPSASQVGVHPDMQDFKDLYDNGKANIIQGVSYENNNGSHFRGRDIWFMGGSSEDFFPSGWVGRYLSNEFSPLSYPDDFPTADMPDPLALEMGNDVSLLFHQESGIPVSLSLGGGPGSLANLIEELEGFSDEGVDPRGLPPEALKNSPYGKEMDWILGLEDKSETYIRRLQQVYEAASETQVSYPERYPFGTSRNPLSGQLRLVARLLDGGGTGVKTKVFLVKIGGFDTHAQQVEDYNTTLGSHASLVYHISSAMRAFQEDLKARGIEDRVLTVTMSEFGRRIGSNGSYGTDHGTGGPVMMFGKYANPGIFGVNPDLTRNNVEQQFDYRQVYSAILKDWLGVDQNTITNEVFYGNYIDGNSFEPMDLIRSEILSTESFMERRFNFKGLYPNPANEFTTVKLLLNDRQHVLVRLLDMRGVEITRSTHQLLPGNHEIPLNTRFLPVGKYIVSVNAPKLNKAHKLLIRR
jgi:uncharacterized protein (DUF1501 family)